MQSYNYSDGIRFSCQHGQRECDGNVFQNCVLDMIGSDRQDVQTNFVICAMDFTKNPAICAKNIGIDVQKANECAHGNKGIQLQLKAEKDSANVISKSSFVPTVKTTFEINLNIFLYLFMIITFSLSCRHSRLSTITLIMLESFGNRSMISIQLWIIN